MAALPTAIRQEKEQLMYRTYVTDSLKVLLDFFGNMGEGPQVEFPRWAGQLEDGGAQPEETRSPEGIIEHIRQRLKEVSS